MKQSVRPQTGTAEADMSYDGAFVQIYQSYYTRVFAYVYSRVGNVERTKDLVAEIFERAYIKGHGLREQAAYATWLFTVARSVVAGHYRRLKRETNGLERVKDSLWLTENHPDPENSAIRSEQVTHLMRHFRTLSQRDQELLSLKFEAELTYAEIARAMGLSEVNVRVSVFRSLRRLRDRMQSDSTLS